MRPYLVPLAVLVAGLVFVVLGAGKALAASTRVEDSDTTRITYSPTSEGNAWWTASSASASGGSYRYANWSGAAEITAAVDGTVTPIVLTCAGCGSVVIKINGQTVDTVSTYSGPTTWQVELGTWSVSAGDVFRFEADAAGEAVYLDALDMSDAPVSEPSPEPSPSVSPSPEPSPSVEPSPSPEPSPTESPSSEPSPEPSDEPPAAGVQDVRLVGTTHAATGEWFGLFAVGMGLLLMVNTAALVAVLGRR